MQREEKQLETSVEALIQRITELKTSIATFLMKLEHEHATLTWPSVLDSFSLLSGQLQGLNRLMRSDKMCPLKNHLVLPLQLSPEQDQQLMKITECRVGAFNHEVVPNYLRTKPEPEVDEKINQIMSKAPPQNESVLKQINTLNKISTHVLEMISSQRDDWEVELGKSAQVQQYSSQLDTNTLAGAVSVGKNLRSNTVARGEQSPAGGMRGMVGQPGSNQPNQPNQGHPGQGMHANKAPSAIKTNIRPANPYGRP
eukprot:GHVU01167231.1.p1 GENE.GHVU01167231.1~~GHVU01167231.1.p1  ORF type:complete len:255 (+),score=34.64 GHVU01167231.1:174-938(+)